MKLEIPNKHFTKEEMKNTPGRFKRFIEEWEQSGDFNFTTFPNIHKMEGIVSVTNISLYSICSHHCLPFFGEAHVGYIPNKKIPGISKIARAVKYFASRPQMQENLTQQIANYLDKKLKPKGVIVYIKAEHLCMSMRGIKNPGHKTITSVAKGVFLKSKPGKTPKDEFMRMIGK